MNCIECGSEHTKRRKDKWVYRGSERYLLKQYRCEMCGCYFLEDGLPLDILDISVPYGIKRSWC